MTTNLIKGELTLRAGKFINMAECEIEGKFEEGSIWQNEKLRGNLKRGQYGRMRNCGET